MNTHPHYPNPVKTSPDFVPDEVLNRITAAKAVHTACEHFGVLPSVLLGVEAPKDPLLWDAQGVTFTLTPLSPQRIAVSTGLPPAAVETRIGEVHERASNDPRYQRNLGKLAWAAARDQSGSTIAAWSDLMVEYFGLTMDKIRAARDGEARRASSILANLLLNHTVLSEEAVAGQTGFDSLNQVVSAAQQVARKRWEDPDFDQKMKRLEAGELPKSLTQDESLEIREVEPILHRLSEQVCALYGVDIDELQRKDHSTRVVRARRVIAYIARDRLGILSRKVETRLGYTTRNINRERNNIRNEMRNNPLLAAQVEYAECPQEVMHIFNELLVKKVAEVTGMEAARIMDKEDSEAQFPRQLVMALAAESGDSSRADILEFFGFSAKSDSVAIHAEAVIEKWQRQEPKLRQALGCVRRGVFSEEACPLLFTDEEIKFWSTRQELSRHGELPEIDENAVNPETVAIIYGNARRAAKFYMGDEAQAYTIISTQNQDFLTKRARRATALLSLDKVSPKDLAICFDNRRITALKKLVYMAEKQREEEPVFARELHSIVSGEERRDMLEETAELITDYFGISRTELATGTGSWPGYAREVFSLVMSKHAYTSLPEVGEVIGRTESAVSKLISRVRQRLPENRRLQADVAHFLDPERVPAPPRASDILEKLYAQFSVSKQQMEQPAETDLEIQVKQTAAYMLRKEFGLPDEEIARELHEQEVSQIENFIEEFDNELAKHPRRVLEVDRLWPPPSTGVSLSWRILQVVKRHTGVDFIDSESERQTRQQVLEACKVAVPPLLKTAGLTIEEVAQLLDQDVSVIRRIAKGTNGK